MLDDIFMHRRYSYPNPDEEIFITNIVFVHRLPSINIIDIAVPKCIDACLIRAHGVDVLVDQCVRVDCEHVFELQHVSHF